MLTKNEDIFSALLTYRWTPLQNGYSPSELLMGRRLQTQLPTHLANVYPNVEIKDRQLVEERKARIGWTKGATLTSVIAERNFQHLNQVTVFG